MEDFISMIKIKIGEKMFYKYSNYSQDQVVTEDYEKICQLFMKMAKDEKTKEMLNRYFV